MSKDQISSGMERSDGQHGLGRLKPRRETKLKGKNRDMDIKFIEVNKRRKILARKRGRRRRAKRHLEGTEHNKDSNNYV